MSARRMMPSRILTETPRSYVTGYCSAANTHAVRDSNRSAIAGTRLARSMSKNLRKNVGQESIRKRSEERRVGKECRSRWTAYNEKKNKKIQRVRNNHTNE